MKKRRFILIFFVLSLYIFMDFVIAMSIVPGKLEYNFEPNMELSLGFSVESQPVKVKIFASGDLAEYVSFDKTELNGSGGFTAIIKLPAEVEKPGPNRLYIMAQQIPGEGEGVATAIAIGALIKINVPYPGKYAELEFSVNDVNVGEELVFNADVLSLGKEDIVAIVNADVSVYNGKFIENFEIGKDIVKPTERKSFQKRINSDKYGAGYYSATVVLDYGVPARILKIEKLFRIGSLFVEITNWTNEIHAGKVNKFDIEVESNWNNRIEHVYANVIVYDNKNENNITAEFKTISEGLERWEEKNLTGYIDATNIKPGIYKTNITVFYENSLTSKIVNINVKREKKIILIVIIAVFVIVLATLVLIVLLIRKKIKKKKLRTTRLRAIVK